MLKDTTVFRLAKYTDPRPIDIIYNNKDCKRGYLGKKGGRDAMFGDYEYCPNGNALSLFPATYVYMIVTMVDPNATYFDRAQHKMVTGPLTTKVFYQFAGKVPDFNKNGIDDLIDLRTKTSVDKNNNGIPDDGETIAPTPAHSCLFWIILASVLVIIIIILIFIIRRIKK
jgi:hypothetical protein